MGPDAGPALPHTFPINFFCRMHRWARLKSFSLLRLPRPGSMPNHLWCKGEGPRQCHKFTYRFAWGKLMHFCGVSSPHFSVPKMEQEGPRPSRFFYRAPSTSQNRRYHFLADSNFPCRTFFRPWQREAEGNGVDTFMVGIIGFLP